MSWYNNWGTNPTKLFDKITALNNKPDKGPKPGQPGSYNGGTNSNGYGGDGEIAGDDQVNLMNLNLPYFAQDRARLGGMMQGQSPYAGSEWGGLISQLQQQASGQGPSLAQDAYNSASQNTTANLRSMANGSASPASARTAMMEQGRVGQGMAQGLATARTQEQLGAQGALGNALGQRDQLNQTAYLNILQQQLGLSSQQLKALTDDRDAKIAKSKADTERKAAAVKAGGSMIGAIAGV